MRVRMRKLDSSSQQAELRLGGGTQYRPNSRPCNCIQFSTNADCDSEEASAAPGKCAKILLSKTAKAQVEIVDKRLKNMMKELGDAINDSLSDSEQIAEVISRIKADGYDVFVVLEATIGFNENENDSDDGSEEAPHSNAELEVTSQDLKFLKSLRISVGEEP